MILAQVTQIDMNTMLSLGVMLAVGGGLIKITSLLTKISMKLDALSSIPERVTRIEQQLELLEDDVSLVFAAVRAGSNPEALAELARRSRWRSIPSKES